LAAGQSSSIHCARPETAGKTPRSPAALAARAATVWLRRAAGWLKAFGSQKDVPGVSPHGSRLVVIDGADLEASLEASLPNLTRKIMGGRSGAKPASARLSL